MSQIIQKIWKIGSIKNLLNKKMILFINKIKRAKMWIMRMFNKLIKLIKKILNKYNYLSKIKLKRMLFNNIRNKLNVKFLIIIIKFLLGKKIFRL